MAEDGCWGDHVVLFAAANRFQTPIRIISSLDHEIVVHPDHALANSSPLVLGHIHELHYVSLQPRQGKMFFPITNILVFWNLYTYISIRGHYTLKVIPWFCTAHLLRRITRWPP